jgi:hypothetical protein
MVTICGSPWYAVFPDNVGQPPLPPPLQEARQVRLKLRFAALLQGGAAGGGGGGRNRRLWLRGDCPVGRRQQAILLLLLLLLALVLLALQVQLLLLLELLLLLLLLLLE